MIRIIYCEWGLAEGVLPSTLEQVTFGYCFNQPLAEGVITPSCIIHMVWVRDNGVDKDESDEGHD